MGSIVLSTIKLLTKLYSPILMQLIIILQKLSSQYWTIINHAQGMIGNCCIFFIS